MRADRTRGSFWLGVCACFVGCALLQIVSVSPLAGAQARDGLEQRETRVAERLIPFQAYLTDTAGRPVEGTHDLAFRVYDDPTQGGMLWSETHLSVPLSKGLVNVILGGTTPFGSLTFDLPRYVGISVDGGVEMVPRQQVIPTIYAADSDRAKQLVIPGTFTPAVTVAANGSVGIGTTDPHVRAHILDGTDVEPEVGGYLQLGPSDGTNLAMDNNEIMARNNGVVADLFLNGDGGNALLNVEGGNVGIGTVSPTNRLSVAGSADFSGSVGIGTASPQSTLHIENGGITVREWFFAPEGQWTTIEEKPGFASGLYTVCVLGNATGRQCTYLVLFSGNSNGVNHAVLGEVFIDGYYKITAEFDHVLESGTVSKLKIRPSETANVYVSKVRVL